jgi:hypothetical protein
MLGRGVKECLEEDKDTLFSFYHYPAEHRAHLRTTTRLESTFATVPLRTQRTKGCGSRLATLTMVYKLRLERPKKLALLKWGRKADQAHRRHPLWGLIELEARPSAGDPTGPTSALSDLLPVLATKLNIVAFGNARWNPILR